MFVESLHVRHPTTTSLSRKTTEMVDVRGAHRGFGGRGHVFCSLVPFSLNGNDVSAHLKSSSSKIQRAARRYEPRQYFTKRSQDRLTWANGVILFWTKAEQTFKASHTLTGNTILEEVLGTGSYVSEREVPHSGSIQSKDTSEHQCYAGIPKFVVRRIYIRLGRPGL